MFDWSGRGALTPDFLIASNEQWKPRWHGVIRWHTKVERLKQKSQGSELDSHDVDDVITFFQNCYHLRDWLQASRPNCEAKIASLFANHVEMCACRDICNGFKHEALKRPSLDVDFDLYREHDHFAAEGDAHLNPVRYRIAFAESGNITKFDLFDLTARCFQIWDNFIFTDIDASSAYTSHS